MLHDEAYRTRIIDRLRTLRHDTARRWGKMSVDQMVWHVNGGLSMALGQIEVPARNLLVPRPVIRFVVLKHAMAEGCASDADVRRLAFVRLRIGTRSVRAADRSARREAAKRQMAGASAARAGVGT